MVQFLWLTISKLKNKKTIIKTNKFYPGNKKFDTGIENNDNIGGCVISLLQLQADEAAH